MKVKDLVEKLSKFDPNVEVIISDGYKLVFYHGDWLIKEFEGKVDIGIGGTDINLQE
jgi:hypothetical protein